MGIRHLITLICLITPINHWALGNPRITHLHSKASQLEQQGGGKYVGTPVSATSCVHKEKLFSSLILFGFPVTITVLVPKPLL